MEFEYSHMEMAMHAIVMNGTHVGTNVQLTFIIHQQLAYKNMSNLVLNCESSSRMNYQGNRVNSACIRNILLMALTIIVFCCSVSQLYKYKQNRNKVRST